MNLRNVNKNASKPAPHVPLGSITRDVLITQAGEIPFLFFHVDIFRGKKE